MRFIQRGGIGDPLAALFTRKGIDDEMGRADQTFLHGGRGLDGDQLIHERLVNAAAKLAEGLGQHKVGLGGIDLVLPEATGVHDGKVGAQAVADILIGGAQFMLEQLQSQQDADGHGPSATRGAFGEACGKTLLDGADQRRPGKGIGPLADGMGVRHKVSDVQAWFRYRSTNAEDSEQDASWALLMQGGREPQDTTRRSTATSPDERGE